MIKLHLVFIGEQEEFAHELLFVHVFFAFGFCFADLIHISDGELFLGRLGHCERRYLLIRYLIGSPWYYGDWFIISIDWPNRREPRRLRHPIQEMVLCSGASYIDLARLMFAIHRGCEICSRLGIVTHIIVCRVDRLRLRLTHLAHIRVCFEITETLRTTDLLIGKSRHTILAW